MNLSVFGASAIVALANATAAPDHLDGWNSATTAELAREFLPADAAREVVSHKISPPLWQGAPPFSITFFGHPHSTADNFCERNRYYVSSLPKPTNFASGKDIRLGKCPEEKGGIFAHVQPGIDVAEAKQALRWLGWARTIARSGHSLAFDVECASEIEPDPCVVGARAALATLPLDKTFIVARSSSRAPGEWDFAIKDTEPGQRVWDVTVRRLSKGRLNIRMEWKVPAPF